MSSRKIKIGLVQMKVSESKDRNLARAAKGVEEAAKKGAGVVCLPELFAWRYFPTVRDSKEPAVKVPGKITDALSDAARTNQVVLVGGSVYEDAGNAKYNTCLVFDEKGKVLSRYRKVHVPQDEHYFEQDYFRSGDEYAVAKTKAGNLGTLICFGQWYPEAARVNRLMGADIVFYPTAIGWVKGIDQVEGDWKTAWEAVQVGHAVANSVIVCAVNRVGTEGQTTFWGGSFVCDQFGKVLFRGGEEEGVFVVECDLGLGKTVEEGWGFLRNRKAGTYSSISG